MASSLLNIFNLPLPWSIQEQRSLNMLRYEWSGMMTCLSPFERQLLKALCESSTQSAVVLGVLALTPTDQAIVANIIEVGLLCFRNRGGKPETTKLREKDEAIGSSTSDISAAEPLQRSTDAPSSTRLVENSAKDVNIVLRRILNSLGIQNPLPPTKSRRSKSSKEDRSSLNESPTGITEPISSMETKTEKEPGKVENARRDERFRTNVRKRCASRCPITGETESIECAHILPHSLLSRPAGYNKSTSSFWILLALLVGEKTRNDVYELVGEGPDTAENGLALYENLHKCFDRGELLLRPFPLAIQIPGLVTGPATPSNSAPIDENIYSAERVWCYGVQVYWMGPSSRLGRTTTDFPIGIVNQIQFDYARSRYRYLVLREPRKLQDQEQFAVFTNYKDINLPHPLLLCIHAKLWHMIEEGGLSTLLRILSEEADEFLGSQRRRQERETTGVMRDEAYDVNVTLPQGVAGSSNTPDGRRNEGGEGYRKENKVSVLGQNANISPRHGLNRPVLISDYRYQSPWTHRNPEQEESSSSSASSNSSLLEDEETLKSSLISASTVDTEYVLPTKASLSIQDNITITKTGERAVAMRAETVTPRSSGELHDRVLAAHASEDSYYGSAEDLTQEIVEHLSKKAIKRSKKLIHHEFVETDEDVIEEVLQERLLPGMVSNALERLTTLLEGR